MTHSLRKVVAVLGLAIFVAMPMAVAGGQAPDAVAEVEEGAAPEPQPLESEELADLEERAEEPGEEVAGGALSNLHLTYIVIALATAIIVVLVT